MNLAERITNHVLHRFGRQLVSLPPVLMNVPTDAQEHLRRNSPELRKLRADYGRCDASVTESFQWKNRTISERDLLGFRGDTAYVWQREADASYVLSARYASAVDSGGLLDLLNEDGMFGARTVHVDGRLVSRDLLDSVLEMGFLSRHNVNPRSVLDIGAGYGRLAHRMRTAHPDIRYFCADAVPVSTFLSRFYLGFRNVGAEVIALPDFRMQQVDLTVNIHSFTECTVQAVKWWLSRVQTTHLMIVPNAMNHGGTRILNSQGVDLMPIIESYGFRLVVKEPKYADPAVQQHGIQPTWYYLFASNRKADEGEV